MPEWSGPIPWILLAYATSSVIAFGLYGLDKRAARLGLRRVPERTLQLWALVGGFPGALLGQHLFHHKTRKPSFMLVFWLIVAAHAAAWAVALSQGWFSPNQTHPSATLSPSKEAPPWSSSWSSWSSA